MKLLNKNEPTKTEQSKQIEEKMIYTDAFDWLNYMYPCLSHHVASKFNKENIYM